MPQTVAENPWLWILGVLLTSGFGKYLIDIYRERKATKAAAPPPTPARQAEIDQSLLAMAKAAQQLEDDNARLRESNHELDEMLRRERRERAEEREAYQREIRALEERARQLSLEVAELVGKLGQLRTKHDTGDIPVVRPADQQTEYRED